MDLFAEKPDGLSGDYFVRSLQRKLSCIEIADVSGIVLDSMRSASVREWFSAAGILVSETDDFCGWQCS